MPRLRANDTCERLTRNVTIHRDIAQSLELVSGFGAVRNQAREPQYPALLHSASAPCTMYRPSFQNLNARSDGNFETDQLAITYDMKVEQTSQRWV